MTSKSETIISWSPESRLHFHAFGSEYIPPRPEWHLSYSYIFKKFKALPHEERERTLKSFYEKELSFSPENGEKLGKFLSDICDPSSSALDQSDSINWDERNTGWNLAWKNNRANLFLEAESAAWAALGLYGEKENKEKAMLIASYFTVADLIPKNPFRNIEKSE